MIFSNVKKNLLCCDLGFSKKEPEKDPHRLEDWASLPELESSGSLSLRGTFSSRVTPTSATVDVTGKALYYISSNNRTKRTQYKYRPIY